MRIKEYKTHLVNGLAEVVKEKGINYKGQVLQTPESIVKLMKEIFHIHEETEEYVYMLCFNTKMKLIAVFEISHGTVNQSLISTREIFQKALLCNATNIILTHNHPSMDVSPSDADIQVTKKVTKAGILMNIQLLDHIIIGDGFYSFRERGEL